MNKNDQSFNSNREKLKFKWLKRERRNIWIAWFVNSPEGNRRISFDNRTRRDKNSCAIGCEDQPFSWPVRPCSHHPTPRGFRPWKRKKKKQKRNYIIKKISRIEQGDTKFLIHRVKKRLSGSSTSFSALFNPIGILLANKMENRWIAHSIRKKEKIKAKVYSCIEMSTFIANYIDWKVKSNGEPRERSKFCSANFAIINPWWCFHTHFCRFDTKLLSTLKQSSFIIRVNYSFIPYVDRMLNRLFPVRILINNGRENLGLMISVSVPHKFPKNFRSSVSLNSVLRILGCEGEKRFGSHDPNHEIVSAESSRSFIEMLKILKGNFIFIKSTDSII